MPSYLLVDDRKLVRLEREAVAIDESIGHKPAGVVHYDHTYKWSHESNQKCSKSVPDEPVGRGEVRLNVRSAGAAAVAGDDAAAHRASALRQGGAAGVLSFWVLSVVWCGMIQPSSQVNIITTTRR